MERKIIKANPFSVKLPLRRSNLLEVLFLIDICRTFAFTIVISSVYMHLENLEQKEKIKSHLIKMIYSTNYHKNVIRAFYFA